MRTDFDYLEIQVIIREYPRLPSEVLVYQTTQVTHEYIENEGLKPFADAISKSIVATIKKKLNHHEKKVK